MNASRQTWPCDALNAAVELPRQGPGHLICFVACAFKPIARADALLTFLQSVCDDLAGQMGARIECVRADRISAPGTIHTDIWRYIKLADAPVFDLSGLNGNVVLELGVAAAHRPQTSILVLRDKDEAEAGGFLFDLSPTRHLLYRQPDLVDAEFRGRAAPTNAPVQRKLFALIKSVCRDRIRSLQRNEKDADVPKDEKVALSFDQMYELLEPMTVAERRAYVKDDPAFQGAFDALSDLDAEPLVPASPALKEPTTPAPVTDSSWVPTVDARGNIIPFEPSPDPD